MNPYDTWEHTESALKAISKLIHLLCLEKPTDKSPLKEQQAWNDQMTEVRAWGVSIHERRLYLMAQMQKDKRK